MSTIPAIYENGVFRPVEPVELPQVTHAGVLLPTESIDAGEALIRRFPGTLGTLSEEDADELQRIVEEEFGQMNPDDWR